MKYSLSVILVYLYNFRKVSEVSLQPRTLTSGIKFKQLAALTDKNRNVPGVKFIKKRLFISKIKPHIYSAESAEY